MDTVDSSPKLVPLVRASGILEDDPFVLFDVGCGMGIDPRWRVFGKQLRAYGFDGNVAEIERLTRAERGDRVSYRAALVGLPDDHPFLRRRREERTDEWRYFDPFGRTSAFVAIDRIHAAGGGSLQETNAWSLQEIATEKVALDAVTADEGIPSVDFVKTDTDGNDLEVLLSGERMLREAGVLGVLVEALFTGPHHETANSFHNIDRYLRRLGFQLYSLSVNRYSRAVLPAQFEHRGYAQTTSGQALWGDALYFVDAGAPSFEEIVGGPLPVEKLLKLACLYELFELADCAVELLVAHRSRLEGTIDVDRALDALTPPLDGRQLTWREYTAVFDRDPSAFFPPETRIDRLVTPGAAVSPVQRVASRVFRTALAVWARTPERARRVLRPAVHAVTRRL